MITIACDKAGVEYVAKCCEYFKENGVEYRVALPEDGSAFWFDYVDGAKEVAHDVAEGKSKLGVLICGTGIGMSIAANKVKGVRASVCSDTFSAEMTRRHNNANVLCMGARVIGEEIMIRVLDAFMKAPFDGETEEGVRHLNRVNKIIALEEEF
ncbi:MAG: ribose 5-phosphate isomerase B [Clostridia bacterium]|nr:ribose 5-phosphate isomerase B [Clostridia bacterium]